MDDQRKEGLEDMRTCRCGEHWWMVEERSMELILSSVHGVMEGDNIELKSDVNGDIDLHETKIGRRFQLSNLEFYIKHDREWNCRVRK